MTESGGAYITSKDGKLRAVIIVFGIISFALTTASGYGGVKAWPFATILISWLVSFILYFFIVVNLISKMDCGVSYEAVDFVLSFIFFVFCMSGSIVLAIYGCSGGRHCDEQTAATVFGFLTSILYFVELYIHEEHVPEPMKYMTTINGIVKVIIITLGFIAFALLVAGGYKCNRNVYGCTWNRTFALGVYIFSCISSVIFFLIHITGYNKKIGDAFIKAEFLWSGFWLIFCLAASILLSRNVAPENWWWSYNRRVAACVFGFFTTIAYLFEAFLLYKPSGQIIVPST